MKIVGTRIAGALAALLFGIAVAAAPVMAQDESAAQPPEELTTVYGAHLPELDPQLAIYSGEAQIFSAIYEGLFVYDPATLEPQRAACQSWTRSPDGKTYTFTLRNDAAWSDGKTLRAVDFRDAWLRELRPEMKADYASFFDIIQGAEDYRTGKTTSTASVQIRVLGEKVLQVKLTSKADYFTRLLCHHSFAPIHPSMLARQNWKSLVPFPVNGPYVIDRFDAEGLFMSKNDHYWDKANVAIPKLHMVFIDDAKAATRGYDNGNYQWLFDSVDYDSLLSRADLKIGPMFGTSYWYFNNYQADLAKADVRRGLALLVPWEQVRSKDFYLMPASTLVLPYAGYEGAVGIGEQDIPEGLKLLEKAGYKDGKGLPPITILVVKESEDDARVADLMKNAWEKQAGLTVKIEAVSIADYFTQSRDAKDSNWSICSTTWIGDFADPLAFLQLWIKGSNLNDSGYSDSEFESLLKKASNQTGKERLASLAKAETRLLFSAGCLPAYYSMSTNVIDSDYIQGWYYNPLNYHPYKFFKFGTRKIKPNVAIGSGLSVPASLTSWEARAH